MILTTFTLGHLLAIFVSPLVSSVCAILNIKLHFGENWCESISIEVYKGAFIRMYKNYITIVAVLLVPGCTMMVFCVVVVFVFVFVVFVVVVD